MSMSKDKRSQQAGISYRISPVAVGCTLLIAAAAASAQQTQQLETVTVTGIRKGIEASISIKKNSDNIVESVSAEDIGKLPDISIAESLGRLPGLSAQRVAVADSLRHATNRYRAGYSTYLEQVDAQRALLSVDLSLIQLRSDRLTAMIALYQAVGGSPQP